MKTEAQFAEELRKGFAHLATLELTPEQQATALGMLTNARLNFISALAQDPRNTTHIKKSFGAAQRLLKLVQSMHA